MGRIAIAYSPSGSKCLFPITLGVLIVLVLLIAELSVARKEEKVYNEFWKGYGNRRPYRGVPSPPDPKWRWDVGGRNEVAKLFLRAFALFADLIHLPIHHYFLLSKKRSLHPVAALVTSVFFALIWLGNATPFILINFSLRLERLRPVSRLEIASLPFQLFIALCYLVYMVCAARRVHMWRRERRQVRTALGPPATVANADDVELQGRGSDGAKSGVEKKSLEGGLMGS